MNGPIILIYRTSGINPPGSWNLGTWAFERGMSPWVKTFSQAVLLAIYYLLFFFDPNYHFSWSCVIASILREIFEPQSHPLPWNFSTLFLCYIIILLLSKKLNSVFVWIINDVTSFKWDIYESRFSNSTKTHGNPWATISITFIPLKVLHNIS